MENLKIKTLAMAICVAVGLSACGDNNNGTLSAQQLSAQQKIDNMLLKLKEGDYFKSDVQDKVFELFPATNTRMEQNLENCQWYAKHDLYPAWANKLTESEIKKKLENENESKLMSSFVDEKFNKNKELIKEYFFTNGKFDDSKVTQEKADIILCLVYPKAMQSRFIPKNKSRVKTMFEHVKF